jgi:hypothetical protein
MRAYSHRSGKFHRSIVTAFLAEGRVEKGSQFAILFAYAPDDTESHNWNDSFAGRVRCAFLISITPTSTAMQQGMG